MGVKFKCRRPRCKTIVDHIYTYPPRCPKCGWKMTKAQPDEKAQAAFSKYNSFGGRH